MGMCHPRTGCLDGGFDNLIFGLCGRLVWINSTSGGGRRTPLVTMISSSLVLLLPERTFVNKSLFNTDSAGQYSQAVSLPLGH